MTNDSWKNPWKLTAIGMALVVATVLVTGLVVANWSGKEADKKVVDVSPGSTAPRVVTGPSTQATQATPAAAGVPTQAAIASCNQSAAAQAGQREKTKDTVI